MWSGVWSSSTTYTANDLVYSAGSTWLATDTPAAGIDPASDPADWTLFAEAGASGATGNTGASGTTGPTGATGVTGVSGASGLNTLVATAPVPVGGTCANGGVMMTVGLDVNGNGVLDPSEVNSALTQYVCNGASGATGTTGATGSTGSTGTTGSTGATGVATGYIVWKDATGTTVPVLSGNGATQNFDVIDPSTGLVWAFSSMNASPFASVTALSGYYYYASTSCSGPPYVAMPPPEYPVEVPTTAGGSTLVMHVAPTSYSPPDSTLKSASVSGDCVAANISTATTASGQTLMLLSDVNALPVTTPPAVWFVLPVQPQVVQ